MPARVIRSEIITSRSLSRVSMEADLTFRNLLLIVDDFGRCDARLAVLRAALYATRPQITDQQIDGWLNELEREGCIRRYEVDGDPFTCLPKWEQHRSNSKRASKSKFPDPPGFPGKSADPRESPKIPENPRALKVLGFGLGDECIVGVTSASGGTRNSPGDVIQITGPNLGPTLAPTDPSEFMLAALRGIFPKVNGKTIRLKARSCLAYYRARGERRTDWTAQVENWIAKDLAEDGVARGV